MLDITALDAFFAGLTTAFFGAIVAGGAYLLKHTWPCKPWWLDWRPTCDASNPSASCSMGSVARGRASKDSSKPRINGTVMTKLNESQVTELGRLLRRVKEGLLTPKEQKRLRYLVWNANPDAFKLDFGALLEEGYILLGYSLLQEEIAAATA